MKRKLVVLTGAGMSAESGIKTFRDAGGLWENHDVMEVASIWGWHKNKALMLEFYNQRRRQLLAVEPNAGHRALVELESSYEVQIITQNVDDLHERAGSTNVLHLHGELLKMRSSADEDLIFNCREDIRLGDTCPKGSQLRPHVVWFGEEVPMLERAAQVVSQAELMLIIGTSMQVYPAAGLVAYAQPGIPLYYIDPSPSVNYELRMFSNLRIIQEKATTGVRFIVDQLLT